MYELFEPEDDEFYDEQCKLAMSRWRNDILQGYDSDIGEQYVHNTLHDVQQREGCYNP